MTQISRRKALGALGTLAALPALAACAVDGPERAEARPSSAAPRSTGPKRVRRDDEFAQLERRFGARLGVYAADVLSGTSLSYRQDERFAMLSTFKVYAVAAALEAHPLSSGYFEREIRFTEADIVENSPVTMTRVGSGMTVAELSEAAITRSDNTAGNLILKLLGGPSAVTEFARSIGDKATRLDRWEPELNSALRGDKRDTTTPASIGNGYRTLVLGDVLAAPERAQLKTWLLHNATGDTRIRAGLPKGWTTGDKTGSGGFGTLNDVAITWSPDDRPLLISVLSDKDTAGAQGDDKLLAETAKRVIEALR